MLQFFKRFKISKGIQITLLVHKLTQFLPWPLPESQAMVLWPPCWRVTDWPSHWTDKNRHVCNWSRVVDFLIIVPLLSHDCLMTVSWLSHDCLMTVSWLSHDCLMTITRLCHDCLMTFSWHLPVTMGHLPAPWDTFPAPWDPFPAPWDILPAP